MSTENPVAVSQPPVEQPKQATIPQPTVATINFKFDKEKCESKLKALRTYLQTFVGKAGYNSFSVLHKSIKPLEDKLKAGVNTKELQDAILSLQEKEPIAVPNNIVNPPKDAQSAGGGGNKTSSTEGLNTQEVKTAI